MIIDVKATRPETVEPTSNNPYRFSEEPKSSRWPYAFAAMLMSIALYLKSIFPGRSSAEAEARSGDVSDEDSSRPAITGETGQRPVAGTQNWPEDLPSDTAQPVDDPIGSGDTLFDLQGKASFETIVSSAFEPREFASFVPVSTGPFNFTGAFLIANDNSASGSVDRGGSGPGDDGPDEPGSLGEDDSDDPDEPGEADDNEPDEEELLNRAPRVNGPVYLPDIAGCSIALLGLSDLLSNAIDPDGDKLSIGTIITSTGTLTATQGGWAFDSSGYGPVTITYEITDGALAVTQTAHFNVVRKSISGGSGDDVLVGTECDDDIDGGGGHDNIDARGGSDTVLGGAGNDHIVAGTGADTVFGGDGNDVVFGGDGNDWISGGEGDDWLFGEAGDDTLFGDKGDDRLFGDDGKDFLFGGQNNDYLSGGGGDDKLLGGDDDDELSGGAGDDIVMGEAGADLLRGNSGNDTMSGGDGGDQVDAGDGADTVIGDLDGAEDDYDGSEGFDTLSYRAARLAVTVDLDKGVAEGEEIGTDQVCNFEAVEAGAGDDTILGGEAREKLAGHEGNDRISGQGGDDIVDGGEGCDVLSGGEGQDLVYAGAGNDTMIGDLDGASDSYDGGAGIDTIDYSAATSSISFDLASGKVTGVEVGEDSISNFEIFVGGSGNDHFMGGGRGISFLGGAGNDLFEFGALSTPGQNVAYEIIDFMAGDRIRVSNYEIFEEVMDSLEDRFEEAYGVDPDEHDLPILISHQYTGDVRRTLIEADLNNDDNYELAITIYGDSQVTVVETV